MSPAFWTNTIWYVLLAIISLLMLGTAIKKSANRGFDIVFTLAVFGFTVLIEVVLVILLDAYDYYPKVVDDSFQDTVIGNIFSQISISGSVMLIIANKLKFRWYLIFAAIYALIEEWFVKLGIFRHHWYRSYITFIGFTLLCWFFNQYHNKLMVSKKKVFDLVVLFLSVFAVFTNTIILPLKLTGLQVFQIDFFGIYSKNHSATVVIYNFIIIPAFICLYRRKPHWMIVALVFAGFCSVQYLLFRYGFILSKGNWIFFVTLADVFGVYLSISLLDRLKGNTGILTHPQSAWTRKC